MNYGSALPLTGGGLAVGAGYIFGVSELIIVAIGIVLSGIVLYRFGSRRRSRNGANA